MAVWVLGHTRTGNWILGTGGNAAVAHASGVPTDRVKVGLFIATASCAELLGILQAVVYNGGNLTNGSDLVFDTLITVIVGRGLVPRRVWLCCGPLPRDADLRHRLRWRSSYTGWDSDYAQLFLGVLLLGAVLANTRVRALTTKVRAPRPTRPLVRR